MSNFRKRGRGGRNFNSRNSNYSGFKNKRKFKKRFKSKKSALDPMMFVKKAEYHEKVSYICENKFSDFDLFPQLQKNISSRGYQTPTPIQDQAIKPLMEGNDLIGIANTGTGKTGAFLIPLINKIAKTKGERVLIVVPTRELAMQVKDELNIFTKNISVQTILCIGGASIGRQIDGLKRKPEFVVGTPGRIIDLQKRKKLKLNEFTNVVLDEVDRMLDMGFIHDMKEIINKLADQRQSMFFSATVPEKTKQLMKEFLTNPITISVSNGKTAKNVDQDIVKTNGRNKVEILHDLLIQDGFDKVLVFGRTKRGVNKLEKDLLKRGFRTAAIHGNKSQGQRQKALKQLRTDQVRILLATDVASRGLDIHGVTHVINYDVPESYDDYIHRIGRTGRAEQKGMALTLID